MAEEVDIMEGRPAGGGRGRVGQEDDDTYENPPESVVDSSSYVAAAGSSDSRDNKRGRYAEEQQQEEQDGSGSGATEALSETFIPVGQPSRKSDSHHHHHFVPPGRMSVHRIAGTKDVEFRPHCDIAGHEHSQCRACHKVDDHAGHRDGERSHDNRLHIVRTLSVKKAIRVMAPAGIVEGRQAASSSSKGERLLLSTAPSGAMDRLQKPAGRVGRVGGHSDAGSSDWTPSPRPNSSIPTEKRNPVARTSLNPRQRTSSRQKAKKVEPSCGRSYESPVVEDPSYSSPENTYRRGMLRTSYKCLALGSTYSSQLPQTSLSSIARARSKETLDELRSYRRFSELPYAAECSICQTKDNQPAAQLASLDFKKRDQGLESVKQALDKHEAGIVQSIESLRKSLPVAENNTRDASTDEQAKDDYLMRQVPPFQGQVQTAPARKERESEQLESQLRRELLAAQETLHGAQEGLDATIDSLGGEHSDNLQAGQNSGVLQTECDYLRQELMHMKRHLEIFSHHSEIASDGSVSSTEQPVDLSRLESAQNLVADLRRTLEESQQRLLQFEDSHEKHEGELHMKLIEMQDREAKLARELQHPEHKEVQEPNILDPHDGQKELMRITNQLHATTKQLQSLQLEYESLNAAEEQCEVLQKRVETLNTELETQKALTRKWKEDSESKKQDMISKDDEAAKMERELQQSRKLLLSKEQATSELTRDLNVHRESLSSKDLILAVLEKEHKQSRESLLAKEVRASELEKTLQRAQETLESKELVASGLQKEILHYREHLNSKELTAIRLDEDLKQHRQSLLVKDQTIAEMENTLQVHRQSISQTEETARNLQRDLEHTQARLHEALDKGTVREKQLNDVVEKDRLRLNEVTRELDITRKKRNDVLAELETKTVQEEHYRRKSVQDLEKAQERMRAVQAQLDVKVQEESSLRRKSVLDLQESQEQLRVLQTQLDAEIEEEENLRLKSAQDLKEARENLRTVQAQLESKTEEEKNLRIKSAQELLEAQEQLRTLQVQMDKKAEEEKNFKARSAQALHEAQEQLKALKEMQAQTQIIVEDERNLKRNAEKDFLQAHELLQSLQAEMKREIEKEQTLRRKSSMDLQELQEQLKSWKELQAQTDGKHKEENNLRKKSVQELRASQEQLRALQVHSDKKAEEEINFRTTSAQELLEAQEQLRTLQVQMDKKAEEEKNFKARSAQALHEAQEQLKALKEMQAQTQIIVEDERNLKRNAEKDFQQAHEQLQSLQAEMKREIEKEQTLRRKSSMDLQLTQEQLKELKELEAQVEGKADEEHKLRREAEQLLAEAKHRLLSEREHRMEKEEEEKHVRRKSMQDLQEIQEKMRTMQYEHSRQGTVSSEKVNVLLAQQKDLVEQLGTLHDEKKQLESDHEQALFELEMIKKVFAGLKLTLAKHDLCVDFVEDVGKVLKDLHTVIDDHKKKQHTRREEYSAHADQEFSNSESYARRSSAGKVLRDLQSMMDEKSKQRRSKGEDYTEHSDRGLSSRVSKKSSSAMGDTSSAAKIKTFSRQETSSLGTGIDFATGNLDGTAKTEVSGGEESRGEEGPLDAVELKEELEDRLDDVLTTFGVHPDSEGITDETYQKLVLQRIRRKPSSDGVDLLDTLNIFQTP